MEEKSRRHNARVETQHASTLKRIFGRIIVNVRRFEKKRKKQNEKNTQPRSRLAFVASATNLGLGTRKLPNAPASEFTSTTTATLTRTRATMWQHVLSVHICAARDMRRLGTYIGTYLRRCGYIFYKTFLIPRRITGETRKG